MHFLCNAWPCAGFTGDVTALGPALPATDAPALRARRIQAQKLEAEGV